jgi:hypothetical protein
MIDISKFSVGHDFASLKTLNCKTTSSREGRKWNFKTFARALHVQGLNALYKSEAGKSDDIPEGH